MILFNVIINFIVGLALILFAKIMFGFEATSFSLFFVVPIGAVIAGIIMCGGFGRGIFKKNIKDSGKLQFINVLIAILFFITVQYAYYQVTYIDNDMNMNYKFQGEHVSNFYFENDEPVNFINFTVDKVNSQVVTFTRRARSIGSVDGNPVVNWVFFAIDFIGFIFGGAVGYGMAFSDAVYCDNCKKYMKQSKLFSVIESASEKVDKLKELVENEAYEDLEVLIKENPVQKPNKNEAFYYNVLFSRCEECSEGLFILKYHALNSKGKYDEDSDKDIRIELSKALVKQLSKL